MYLIKQTCKECGRDSQYPSDLISERKCPLCYPNRTVTRNRRNGKEVVDRHAAR